MLHNKSLDLTASNVASFGNASRAAGQLSRYATRSTARESCALMMHAIQLAPIQDYH